MGFDILDKKNVFAVVGVSRNPQKYGHKVFFDLKNAGFEVYGVNPSTDSVNGIRIYPSLKDLPRRPDVVVCVVPPQACLDVLRVVKEVGIKNVWMQPGSESEEAIEFCRKNGIKFIANACVMVERLK